MAVKELQGLCTEAALASKSKHMAALRDNAEKRLKAG